MPDTFPATGSRHGQYTVVRNQPVPELNLTAIQMRHEPTGARLLHLACDDPNNVFAVGFRTPPPDSTGIAHILEHTTLCGSKNYPVRDPFFAMLKRSLNTFMNAMTASDWTFYPVASLNRKDLDNLMAIYLDATFFPLLREMDFRQEGHRLEFDDPNDIDSLQIKGVVFNEMKGAMADPSSLLNRRLNKALFPTVCYGRNSGGEPVDIPDLTWQQLRDFHDTYYHPSNSWIFTSGDRPLPDVLDRIEALALSKFERLELDSRIPREPRFAAPRSIVETFPVGPEDDLDGRSMVQVAWLTCPIEDTFERAATGILSNLLLGNPAAPLYQALLDSKLGKNLCPGTGYHDDYRDTFIAAGLQGTDPEQAEAIERVVLDTLQRIAEAGFPEERVAAALHQYEFSHREVTGDQYPYGLSLMMRLLGPWLHADDPISSLQLEQNLARLREATADPRFFPDLIRRHLLDNPHRIRLTLRPDRDHAAREEQVFTERIQAAKTHLDEAAVAKLKADAEALQRSQETPDDTSCLPTVELSDIDRVEPRVDFRPEHVAGCPVHWFDQPTNGLTYLSLQFDASALTPEQRPYLPLFCAILPQVGAAGQDYLAMTRRITAATGGIRLGTNLLEDPTDLDPVRPVVDLKAKALDRNQAKLIEILRDMLTVPDFSDLDRLRTVLGQIRTAMENSIPGAGHSFASRAAASHLTATAWQREQWSGMNQVRLIKMTSQGTDADLKDLAAQFESIAANLLTRDGLAVAVTAESQAHAGMNGPLQTLLEALPEAPQEDIALAFARVAEPAAIGWIYNLPVAYVARVFRTVPYTHPDAAPLQVLVKLLRSNFLHREIREKGGAYGGMASYSTDGGLLSLLSYRDPHLSRTLDVYRRAVDWASTGEFTDDMVKEAILAAFGDLDRPVSPAGRGHREFIFLQQGLTHAMRQDFRDGLLATDAAALARVARTYLADGWNDSAVGVLTGEEKFRQERATLEAIDLKIEKL